MRRILIPVDFSPLSDKAIEYARAFTKHSEAEFFFFHAGKASEKELRRKAENLALILPDSKYHKAHFITSDIEFTPAIVKNLVIENRITLVIMGTQGEHGFGTGMFNSNTASVMDACGVPVIAVPANYLVKEISRISYAADLLNFEKELETVVEFARSVNGSVDVFHVSPVFPDFHDTEKINAHRIVEQVKDHTAFPYIKYHLEEMEKDNQVAKGIYEHINEHPADLLVLFHAGKPWLDKIFDSGTAAQEISNIRIPVIIFPKKFD